MLRSRKLTRNKLSMASKCPVEMLEQRRLLSVVLNGTSGNDTFIMERSGNTTSVYLNQQLIESSSTETTFTLNGLDGNDTIELQNEPPNARITVNGGNGNDTITASDSSFSEIGSGATIDVIGGNNTDTMTMNDTNDSAPPTWYIDNTGFGTFSGNKHVITVENDVEAQTYNFSNAANYLYVGSTETGMDVNFGSGNDTVNFGGGDSIIPSNLVQAYFYGNLGTNKLIFDDSAHDLAASDAEYSFSQVFALNQRISAFQQIELDVAHGDSLGAVTNSIDFTSIPIGVQTITINGTNSQSQPANNLISIGTSSSPLDFDSFTAAVNFNLPIVYLAVHDQDSDGTGDPWLISSTANSASQLINKGNVTLTTSSADTPQTTYLYGGSTGDTFEVAGFLSSRLEIFGGAGDDSLLFVNSGADQHEDDLTALMNGRHLFFQGDAGTDRIDADDSGGAVGAGSNSYLIAPNGDDEDNFSDPSMVTISKSTDLVNFDAATTENVGFVADNGNNAISFGETGYVFNLVINGGVGNDTFSQYAGFNPGPSTLIGGNGTDALIFDGRPLNRTSTIGFTGNTFWSDSTTESATIDSTIESCVVYTSKDGSTVNIASKTAALPVSVIGGAANDQFFVGGGDLDSNGLAHLTISGGGGTNSLEFDDQSDTYSSSETETYTLNSGELDKGTATFPYTNFQSLTLRASTTGSNVQTFGSTVLINAAAIPTTVYACVTRSAIIDVGNATTGDLSTLASPVTLVMGGVGGAYISDQNSTGDKTYSFLSSEFIASSGQTVNFSGGGVTLNGNGGNNQINVFGTTSSAPLTINANGGNDTITMGGGNLAANLISIPTIDGGAGINAIVFDDSTDITARTGTISSSSFVWDRTYTYQTNMQSLGVLTGNGGSAITVNSLSKFLTLTGGGGNDSFTVGSGILDAALENNIVATGGGGTNSILLDDHLQNTPRTYTIDNNGNFFEAAESNNVPDVTATGFASYTINCNNGSDTINDSGSVPVTILGNGGDDKLTTNGSSTRSPNVTFDGGTGNDIVNVNTNGVGNSVVNFTTSQTLSNLSIGSGGDAVAVAGSGLVINTKALAFSGTTSSYLDLNDNDMVLDYSSTTPISNVVGWIAAARNGGTWNGATGITSTRAKSVIQKNTTLGTMEATDYKSIYGSTATFDGQTIDDTAVLIKYTYYGDANFNGAVDGGDYARIDFTFGQETGHSNIGGWINGDFNGDGKVDGSDYGLIDFAFSSQAGTLRPGVIGSIQPAQSPHPAPSVR